MKYELITPEGVRVTQEIDYLGAMAEGGSVGILNNHAPLVAVLRDGIVTVRSSRGTEQVHISSGILKVGENRALILAEKVDTGNMGDFKVDWSAVEKAKAKAQQVKQKFEG